MRRALVIAVVCALGAPAFAQPERKLELADAILFASEHSPALDVARATTEISDLALKSAYAKLLPSADVSAIHGLQDASQSSANPLLRQAPWYSQLNFGLTESLYDNGESITRIHIARIQHELDALTLSETQAKLALDVARAFYQYSLNARLADVQKQQYDILQKEFSLVSGEFRQGMKTKQDYLRLKAMVQRGEIDYDTAVIAIDTSSAELRRLVGAPNEDASSISFVPVSPEATPQDTSKVPEQAPPLATTYESRLASLNDALSSQDVTLAERRYYPQISLNGSVAYANTGYIRSAQPFSATGGTTWNALLTLSYNLWDWGTRGRDVDIARQRERIQQDTQNSVVYSTRSGIESLMLDLKRLRATYKLDRELLDSEIESYSFVNEQYREGKISYLDLITSLSNLLDARVRFYTAHFDLLTSLAQYRYYEGTLYETLTRSVAK